MDHSDFRKFAAVTAMVSLLLSVLVGCKTATPEQGTAELSDAPTSVATVEGVGEWDDTGVVTNPATDPTQNSTTPATAGQASVTPPAIGENGEFMPYQSFISMPPADQQKAMESYFGADADGIAAFHAWLKEAKAAYEKENPSVDGDGSFDLGDY